MNRKRGGWLFALALMLLTGSSARAGLVIDAFNNDQRVRATGAASQATGAVAPGIGEVLGGDRKLVVNRTSTGGSVDANINDDDPDKFDFATLGTKTTGNATLIYDRTTTFTGTGNTGVHIGSAFTDVTEHGTDLGLNISAFADHSGVSLLATFYDTMGRTKSATISLIADPTDVYTNYFKLFSSFTGTADLTHVAAFTLQVTATKGSTNVSLDYIVTSRTSAPFHAVPEPATLAMVGMSLAGGVLVSCRRKVRSRA